MRTAVAMLADLMPKGLYARALIIIIAPIVLLEGVVAFVFMERHWNAVTRRLSEATVARHRGADRRLRGLLAQRRLRPSHRDGARPPQSVDAGAAARRFAAGPAAPVLRPARPHAVRGAAPADQASVLDRYRRQLAAGRGQGQAQDRDASFRCHAQPDIRVQLGHLHGLHGRLVGGAADARDPVPAQSDPSHPQAGGGGRRIRQGPADRRGVPPTRRARGAAGRAGVPRDARPHQDPCRAAHDHAGRRQPRPAHHPHPLQAAARAARQPAGDQRAEDRRQRDAAHAGGLSGVHARRWRRGGDPDQPARAARGGASTRRRSTACRSSSSCASASPT